MLARGCRATVAIGLFALALLAFACDGGSSKPEATSTNAPLTSTASPVPDSSLPPKPAALEDYPAAIAAYLDKAGDAALGEHCLADLLAAWQMPEARYIPPGTSAGEGRCVLGNTDDDPENEVVVSLSASGANASQPHSTGLTIFDHTPTGYEVAFGVPEVGSRLDAELPAILAVGDLNDNEIGDLAFAEITCGAHTCTWHVHVVTGAGGTYRELTLQDGLSLETADVRIEDTDGNGTKEIIMHGGIIESVGAGPQRVQTDVYAWDGTQYTLRSSRKDASDLRLFKVQDADVAFAAGNYQEAARLYEQAVNDTSLKEVGYFGSRDELMAYAMFRLGLSELKLSDTNAASRQIESAIGNYPVSLHGKAAVAFRNAINLTRVGAGDLSVGCQAAIALINQNLDRFKEIWNYGYANPEPTPEEVCPF